MDANVQTPDQDPQIIPIANADLESIAGTSVPFVGNWQSLISQTNWEKGQIIMRWREKLRDSGVPQRLYSDPAWSRLVGEVSAQHVGRLRRTAERFGEDHQQYEGLYWSHFFAALDWHDAEMWLEGAVQNKWSVSKMRFQRWETMGAVKKNKPDPLEIVSSPEDEGVRVVASAVSGSDTVHHDDLQAIQGPFREAPDFGDEEESSSTDRQPAGERVDIAAILEELPKSIARPFRALRSAIADAKASDWSSAKRIHIVALVNDLRQLLRNVPAVEPKTED